MIKVDELTEPVPLQEMDEYDITDYPDHIHTISNSNPDGNLQLVLISPIAGDPNPYQCIEGSAPGDFGAKVDPASGNVKVELRRPGVYLVKTIRQNGSKFFELSNGGADPGAGKKLKKANTMWAP